MAYAYTNKKDKTDDLHARLQRDTPDPPPTDVLSCFAKTVRDDAIDAVPEGYVVSETKNGLPVLKKIR